ncbi:hypothetical protein BC940DRAFT_118286 [Gongronella butleri]|nr:hypothetical protein BC940DRAFT_118286 [Gongronella butleri]
MHGGCCCCEARTMTGGRDHGRGRDILGHDRRDRAHDLYRGRDQRGRRLEVVACPSLGSSCPWEACPWVVAAWTRPSLAQAASSSPCSS